MRRIAIWIVVLSLLLVGCAGRSSKPPAKDSQTLPVVEQPEPDPEPVGDPGILTGLRVDPEAAVRRPVAVMVGNDPKARPQNGLSEASVVYEMLAEGGITRFMALFAETDSAKIGPVRSARHYFVYAAAGDGAVYAHCGGSPQAYAEIPALKLQTLDDMKIRDVFVRSPERTAPHNLYTSTEVLRKNIVSRGWEELKVSEPPWVHIDEPISGEPANKIKIAYPGGYQGYTVNYEYEEERDSYARYIGDTPHIDLNNDSQIHAGNVLVLYIKSWPIPNDSELRIDMDIVGSGKGEVFSGGVRREITWSKQSKTSAFVFKDTVGDVLGLKPGTVWIQVVPLNTDLLVDA